MGSSCRLSRRTQKHVRQNIPYRLMQPPADKLGLSALTMDSTGGTTFPYYVRYNSMLWPVAYLNTP